MNGGPPTRLSRRAFLGGAAAAALAAACGPQSATAPGPSVAPGASGPSASSRAKRGGQVIVRALGGAYQTAEEAAIFKPFTEETGTEVVLVPATAAQVLAGVKQGKANLDVLDLGELGMLNLQANDALERLSYDDFKRFNAGDIQPYVRRDFMIGNIYFATVMAYRTDAFIQNSHPRSWKEFWDIQRFPGPRSLEDQKAGSAELEFALIADGLAAKREALYPLDVDRALRSMSRVRPSIVKFWDTGALSAEFLERKEVVLAGVWNGRVQDLIDKGVPVAIEWNESKRLLQFWGIPKGAPNRDNAYAFIDFAMQPKVQAALTKGIAYGPTNTQAMQYVRPDDAKKLPTQPEHFANSFDQDAQWWANNLKTVTDKWQVWLLSNTGR